MKKLALKLDDLRVETFTTDGQDAARGTVQGHYGSNHTQAGYSCDPSCNGSCVDGCNTLETCEYTCMGWVTYGPGQANCAIC